mmetsp:Transcript_63703/g.170634  ORF Transcript_63703/g.170634 Transcript_63703/m.170634 type:complete len:224 (+) Transcript_63703:624-1295(+)
MAQKSIVELAQEGNQRELWRILHDDPHLVYTTRDHDGGTALHAACAAGRTGTAQYLLQLAPDAARLVHMPDSGGRVALHAAAAAGRALSCALLINWKADVNAADEARRCPLWLAAAAGRQGTVGLLIDYKAEIDATDALNQTALIVACRSRHPGVVRLLLARKADPNAEDCNSCTALTWAADRFIVRATQDDEQAQVVGIGVLESLLKAQADPNWVMSIGNPT